MSERSCRSGLAWMQAGFRAILASLEEGRSQVALELADLLTPVPMLCRRKAQEKDLEERWVEFAVRYPLTSLPNLARLKGVQLDRLLLISHRGCRQAFLLIPAEPGRVKSLMRGLDELIGGRDGPLRSYCRRHPDGAGYLLEPLDMDGKTIKRYLDEPPRKE